jgi:hypothetical protein
MMGTLAAILSLALLASPPPTLQEQLRGTWRIVSFESSKTEGKDWFKRYGDGPRATSCTTARDT